MDLIINSIHSFFAATKDISGFYEYLCLAKFPHALLLMPAANAINASIQVYDQNIGKPRLYWLHSLLLVIATGFGGGIIAPLLIGKPGLPFSNDCIIPICIICWYCTQYLGFAPFLKSLPVKIAWSILLALFRTHTVCNMVNVAFQALSPSYYDIPLIGPIAIGTVLGSAGAFLPFDKGLSVVSNATAWPLQGAFLTAAFYHIACNDMKGPVGAALRGITGTHSEATTRVILASMHLLSLLTQACFHADANLFTPAHKLLYLLFQVEGPKARHASKAAGDTVGWSYGARQAFERVWETSRVFIVIAAIGFHAFMSAPPVRLQGSGSALGVGGAIGSCQLLTQLQGCTPRLLTLESVSDASNAYRLVSLTRVRGQGWWGSRAASPDAVTYKPEEVAWSLDLKTSSYSKQEEVSLVLDRDGALRLVSESGAVVWESQAGACPGSGKGQVYLALGSDGKPLVHCSDGSTLAVF